jgi:four helix bundle suffix protein
MEPAGFIPPHGNYRELLSYQKAEVVYDLTYRFCKRFLSKGDRTVDQMVQAARSGKQNIAEGSKAAGTSKETEVKLTNVARASLEELLVDYRDFLRVRDLRLWDKDSKEARFVRRRGNRPHATYEDFREFCETRPAEVVANIAICLIHQANYLLDRQIRRLEQDFIREGGIRERMTRARLQYRNGNPPPRRRIRPSERADRHQIVRSPLEKWIVERSPPCFLPPCAASCRRKKPLRFVREKYRELWTGVRDNPTES